jgi:integrase
VRKKRTRQVPKYRRQKRPYSDSAFVEINGKRIYLGPHGTKESVMRYQQVLAEAAAGILPQTNKSKSTPISITQICDLFMSHAASYYLKPDGKPTSEVPILKMAIKPLRELYGESPAVDFGPKRLKAVRHAMVKYGWCRTSINQQIGRIRKVFRWAVAEELLPESVYGALMTVEGLKRGRSNAEERPPVKPVPQAHVDAIRPLVGSQVEALIDLQLLTGARAGELVIMRPVDIDTGGKIWVYIPSRHKTEHHGHSRTIFLGPKAQAVVAPFLAGRAVDDYCFSPREAETERRQKVHEDRETPLSCGNRPGTNRKARPKKEPGERYTVDSYRRAIQRACVKVEVPSWHPHQLRHSAATFLRKEFGLETARIILGHKSAAITEVYAEKDMEKAFSVMEQVG